MDILQTLDNELKNKNWTLEEKKRYLYIRSCELFTYDTRYYFLSEAYGLHTIKNASTILDSIKSKEIDLTNVTDNRVYCYSWAKVYKKMLKELLNVKATVEENRFGTHVWVFFGHKADATVDSDLTRVKMKLCTLGYELSTANDQFIYDSQTSKKVKLMDKNIGYIKKKYCDIEPLIKYLILEFHEQNLTKEEELFWWLYHLIDTYQLFQKNLPYFEDASFCISYLFNYFITNKVRKSTECVTLLDDSRDYWDFMDIYKIPYLGNTYYFALLPCEEGYDFMEIPYLDVLNYAASFQGPRKKRLLTK